MTPIHPDHGDKRLTARYVRKKSTKPLKGCALDICIRFNKDGVPFLDDLNTDHDVRPFTNVSKPARRALCGHQANPQRALPRRFFRRLAKAEVSRS